MSDLPSLHHIQIAMPAGQESRARWFYGELLGLMEIPKLANLAARGGVWFATGNLEVHLGVDSDFRAAGKAHPAFLVADLTALVERFATAGITITTDEPLAGYDRRYVADPFGNRIELLEATGSTAGGR
jgi:catechol 2,3-dioxygenase-like lactoylglutathione lyase family enzyme